MSIRVILLAVLTLAISHTIYSQSDSPQKSWTIGPEFQAYPTGLLPGVRLEHRLSDQSSINFRVAAQIIDHRDLGVHDDETGSGWGFSLGYRRYLSSISERLSISARADLWFNTIDWTDNNPAASGTTEITVLQPVALLEYDIVKNESISITPSLGFGYEWNAKTVGEPTGEGAILLIGISAGFAL